MLALPASAADQQLARDRVNALGAKAATGNAQRIFVQYRDAADLDRVNEVRSALAVALKPALIAAAEPVASSAGDVLAISSPATKRSPARPWPTPSCCWPSKAPVSN